MSTLTPNYSFVLPGTGDPSDQDIWGNELNGNTTSLDSLLKVATDTIHRTISANDTVIASDRNKILLVDATAGAVALGLTLSATLGDGFTFSVKKIDSSANAVTLAISGSDTIDGQTSYVISSQYGSVGLIADGGTAFNIDFGNGAIASTTAPGIIQLATQTEVNTGTDTHKAVTPATLSTGLTSLLPAHIGFSNFFQSTPQAISNNVTVAHGLATQPVLFTCVLKNTTAEAGYSIGDEINLPTPAYPGGAGGTTFNDGISSSATNLTFSYSVTIAIANKSTGAVFDINNANWKLVFRAWA